MMTTAAAQNEAKAPPVDPREIVITESAAQEIAKQRDKRGTPDAKIRVGVRGGGCTGFSYVFEWADQVRPTDKVFTAYGVSVVVDPKSFAVDQAATDKRRAALKKAAPAAAE